MSFFFTRDAAVFAFGKGKRGHALALRFVDADPGVVIVPEREARGRVNYLLGSDPAKWKTGLPTYGGLVYRELWPGIDLAFRGANGRLKYEFRLRPGADPGRIRLGYEGAERLWSTGSGALAIGTSLGVLRDTRPVSFQRLGRKQQSVTSGFRLLGSSSFGFSVGSYDRRFPLVIDPGLAYSTYLGGSRGEGAEALAVDGEGNAYVTAFTRSFDFPTTPGAFDRQYSGAGDVFVSKLSADGSTLVYSTFLGGFGGANGEAIAVDGAGNAYVTGEAGPGFPTTRRAFDRSFNGEFDDAFVTKLSVDGSRLVYSTYLGSGGIDHGFGIAVDAGGNAFSWLGRCGLSDHGRRVRPDLRELRSIRHEAEPAWAQARLLHLPGRVAG